MSPRPDVELATRALDMAYEMRGKPEGVMFHSDQGTQYGARKFRQGLWRYQITKGMSRRGNCWDNSPMELGVRVLLTTTIINLRRGLMLGRKVRLVTC